MKHTVEGRSASEWALIILAFIATVAALDLAQALLAPFVLALVCAVVLSPLSNFWKRFGLPPAVGALLSLGTVLSLLGILVFIAEPMVERAYAQIPDIKRELSATISQMQDMFRGISDVTKEVQDTISPDASGENGESVNLPSLGDAVFAAPSMIAQILLFAAALFFILLTRDDVYEGLTKVHPDSPSGACLRGADARVSRYFLTITLINTCFGIIVASALWALGLPGPMLWGMIAAVMNFLLYIGPAMVAVSLIVAGVISFDGAMSLAPAAAFVSLNMMEGQFITPTLVGRHMQVNPLLVFLSLCFWLWLWGPVGGFIAIPLLVWGIAVFEGWGPAATASPQKT